MKWTHVTAIGMATGLMLALPWAATANGPAADAPPAIQHAQKSLDELRTDARRDVRALWRAHTRARLQPAWLIEGAADSAQPAVERAMRHTSARIGALEATIASGDVPEPLLVDKASEKEAPVEEPVVVSDAPRLEASKTLMAALDTAIPAPVEDVEEAEESPEMVFEEAEDVVEEAPVEAPAIAAVAPRDALAEEVIDKAPPIVPTPGPSLVEQRGDLHPPMLFGRVTQPFGTVKESKRSKNELRHTGITIQAPGGHRVRAVGDGKVVYAKGYKGYGLMVIIEHAGGYHSIYARLKNIMVLPNTPIKKGAPLGTIGVTQGDPPPRIYFELRHEGRPMDPAGWFGAPGKYRR